MVSIQFEDTPAGIGLDGPRNGTMNFSQLVSDRA
jgi:hypothetical protein